MTALTTEARLAITAAVTGLGYKVYTSTPPVPIPPSIVIMADSPWVVPERLGRKSYRTQWRLVVVVNPRKNSAAQLDAEDAIDTILGALPVYAVVTDVGPPDTRGRRRAGLGHHRRYPHHSIHEGVEMPATSIAGATFTVQVGNINYSAQVTSGTLTSTSTITRTRTLDGNAFSQTDLISSVSLSFLYDDNAGCFDALQTVIDSGASIAVAVDGATGVWTGAAMYCESAETTFDATGVAMCTAQLTGVLAFV
jgi:hypothetical protein